MEGKKQYIIGAELRDALLMYLKDRPLGEIYGAYNALSQLPELAPNEAEPKEKEPKAPKKDK